MCFPDMPAKRELEEREPDPVMIQINGPIPKAVQVAMIGHFMGFPVCADAGMPPQWHDMLRDKLRGEGK
jgi:hypothetical protein